MKAVLNSQGGLAQTRDLFDITKVIGTQDSAGLSVQDIVNRLDPQGKFRNLLSQEVPCGQSPVTPTQPVTPDPDPETVPQLGGGQDVTVTVVGAGPVTPGTVPQLSGGQDVTVTVKGKGKPPVTPGPEPGPGPGPGPGPEPGPGIKTVEILEMLLGNTTV